jgi:hypothetical protein
MGDFSRYPSALFLDGDLICDGPYVRYALASR